MDKGNENIHVLEWTIKNFSCWNCELHGKVITSAHSKTSSAKTVELYPRGLSGHDEHLVVHLRRFMCARLSGDMSFVGSDGSLFCTQQVSLKNEKEALELPPGPKFEEVVHQIRENVALHRDKLTLRCRLRRKGPAREEIENMCTTINAFDVSFKISSQILHNLNSTQTEISWLNYPLNEEEMDSMLLQYVKDRIDHSKIGLSLSLYSCKKNVSVLTRMSVFNNEDLVRTEENEHLFRIIQDQNWNFSNSLTREEVEKSGFSFTLYFKITPSRKYNHCLGFSRTFRETVHVIPTSSFELPGTSISEENSSSSTTPDTSNKPANSVTVLTKELMYLYQDQDFSDFQLKCDNVTFPVHKNILSARSPVFKTMLSCDMKEAVSGRMDIVDLDPSTLGLFLTFLYTGAVEDLQSESALKLYNAADKYQVPSLKKECTDFLKINVSISNECDILSLADKHQDDNLSSVAHEFFLKNYNEVLASEEWKGFMSIEPFLAVKTLTHFGEKKFVSLKSS